MADRRKDCIEEILDAIGRKLKREQIEERWGLDQPPVERFATWAGNVLTGDLGTSQVFGEPVTTVIAERFMASLPLLLQGHTPPARLSWLWNGML